jgi:uncharacterized protein (TIGR02246 family)
MTVLGMLCGFLFFLPAPIHSTPDRSVLQAENRRLDALEKGDTAAVADMLADEFVMTRPNDTVLNKQQYLQALKSGALRFKAIHHDDVQVRVVGSAAVITGRASAQVHDASGDWTAFSRYTHTYVERDGHWVVLAIHVSPPLRTSAARSPDPAMASTLDEGAIRQIISDNTEAYNRRDARALTAHIAEDADHIGVSGNWTSGRAQLEKSLTEYFGGSVPRPKTDDSVEKIRFLTPDMAVAIVKRSYRSDAQTRESIATYVLKKTNGEWWITAFQNTFMQ